MRPDFLIAFLSWFASIGILVFFGALAWAAAWGLIAVFAP